VAGHLAAHRPYHFNIFNLHSRVPPSKQRIKERELSKTTKQTYTFRGKIGCYPVDEGAGGKVTSVWKSSQGCSH
jgi:hypothetical protein